MPCILGRGVPGLRVSEKQIKCIFDDDWKIVFAFSS